MTLILSSPTNPSPAAPDGRFRTTVARLGRAIRSRRADPATAAIRSLVPTIRAELAERDPEAARWTIAGIRPGEPVLVSLAAASGALVAVVRVARTPAGRRGLDRAAAALSAIPSVVPAEAGTILPILLGGSVDDGLQWLAERSLPGVSASTLRQDPARRRRTVDAIVRAVAPIHAATTEVTVGDDLARTWILDRAAVVAGAMPGESLAGDAVRRLGDDLAGRLVGRQLAVGWIHGDLWAANVLVDPLGAVRGIVDWDSSGPHELALHDRLHLALTTRRRAERRHLGPVLADLLESGRWADDDRAALGLGPTDAVDADRPVASLGGLDAISALWLYWLRFVEVNLARHPDLVDERAWLGANLKRVIACL